MSRFALIGRADLVRLVGSQGEERTRDLARQFGYEPVAKKTPKPEKPSPLKQGEGKPVVASAPEIMTGPPVPAGFWLAETCTPIPGPHKDKSKRRRDDAGSRSTTYPGWHQRPVAAPSFKPLSPWRDLIVRLRHALGSVENGRSIDIDQAVARISEGEVLEHFPRTSLFRWCGRVQVIFDRSLRLIPYFDDQHYIAAHIRRLVADSDFWPAVMRDGGRAPRSFAINGDEIDHQWPPPGTPVLVMGDLGCLTGAAGVRRFWLEFGRRLRSTGCRPVALFPADPGRCPPELAAVWTLVPWERPRLSVVQEADEEEPATRLLRLVSSASRIEPGLLRAVRRLMPEGVFDAGVEAEVWQHPWLESASPAGATIHAKHQAVLRQAFVDQTPVCLRREVVRTIRSWRAGLPEEIWFRELLSLDPESQAGVPTDDLEDARQYERAFCAELDGVGPSAQRGLDLAWQEWSAAVATRYFWDDHEVGSLLVQLNHRLNRDQSGYRLPPGVTPDRIEADSEATLFEATLTQVGGSLFLGETPKDSNGFSLARLWSLNGLVTVVADEEEVPNDPAFWKSGAPPPWAEAWGRDDDGAWVTF
ncbi:MAG: hypothetical protein HQL52_19860, partial [Magnetococcales bacterium]|nr:hypothetical protein [Magnetococcales bacterium]